MKIINTVVAFAILIVMIIGVVKLSEIDEKTVRFYQTDTMKINLTQVKKIIPRVDYIITYEEDSYGDIFRKYSTTLNTKEIENITSFLQRASKSDFYSVEIVAYMMLDNEKVELFHSQRYLKYASKYSVNESLLKQLSSYGLDNFQYENLSKIKDKLYDNVDTFVDDVVSYARLKKSEWSKENIPKLGRGDKANKFMSQVDMSIEEKTLTTEDIEKIKNSLTSSYAQYNGLE